MMVGTTFIRALPHLRQRRRSDLLRGTTIVISALLIALITSGCSKWNDHKESYLDDHWGWVETSGRYEVDWIARMIGVLGVEEGEPEGWWVTKDRAGHLLNIVRFHRSRPTGEAYFFNQDMTLRVNGRINDRGFLSSFVVVDTDTVMTYGRTDPYLRLWKEGKVIGTHFPRPRIAIWGSSTPPIVRLDNGFIIVDIRGELVYDSTLRLIDDRRSYHLYDASY